MLKKTRHRKILGKIFSVWATSKKRKRIAFSIQPKQTPFGGANEFIKQLASYLAWNSCEIVYELDPLVSHVFIMDVREIETSTITLNDIKKFKKRFPKLKVVHRINNCDNKYSEEQRLKPGHSVDSDIIKISSWVDESIFISNWLESYFRQKGYPNHGRQRVITNAAEDLIFYPCNNIKSKSENFKIVTHHWSDNWLKGYKVYQQIDEMIASGELRGFELTIIGRWPNDIQWKSAKTYGPMQGIELANKLREHHLYVTASQYEPGGMHFIEGMQCGLPVVYHKDGGGICEVARRAGIMFDADVKSALLESRERYAELREKVLKNAPSSKVMCEKFYKVILDHE